MNDVLHWYCPDCGAKGYVRTEGDPASYDTLYSVGSQHRAMRAKKCFGSRIFTGDVTVWPQEAAR